MIVGKQGNVAVTSNAPLVTVYKEIAVNAQVGDKTTNAIKNHHRYRVVAWWTSGQTGIAKSDSAPSAIHFSVSPKFLRGLEGRWTPEDLLLCAVASCYTTTFNAIAIHEQFEYTDLGVEAEAIVSKADPGYSFSEIVIRPTLTIPQDDGRERALDLLGKANALCLVSRALATPQTFEARVEVSRLYPAGPSANMDQPPQPSMQRSPLQYVWPCTMKDGTEVVLRPICPEDEPLMVKFHETLSDRSVYFRYFHSVSLRTRVAHERLARICFVDHDRELVLVADYEDPKTGHHRILGVGRLNKVPERNEGEAAVLVSDQCQSRGLGTELLRQLILVALDQKLTRVTVEMLRENLAMQTIVKRLGFRLRLLDDPTAIRAFRDL